MNYGWLEIGKYRVFARPLHLNPAFTTHHIHYKGQLVGRCLSVPDEATCDWYLYQSRHPVDALDVVVKPFRYGRGRPTNAARAAAEQEPLPA